ncbi:hypothetical protein [Paenibacillus bovis]|uniref:Succinate dehydrogenase n=1 Tax=Paenibacillus bovis TaxID=1616788 RepID=A0A1X9T3W2_9BACL|nr:hypothetical protein [Paenibacillus bovis]ARR10623.1 hypothetical protein AR543_p0015 [Paenibacillus bovis]
MPMIQKFITRYVFSAMHMLFMVLVTGTLFFKGLPIGDSVGGSLLGLGFIFLAGIMPVGFALHEAYHKKADFWYVYGRSGVMMMVVLLIGYLVITGQISAMLIDLLR